MDDPVREAPAAHECVCLLIKGRKVDPVAVQMMQEAAEAAGIPSRLIENLIGNHDKCHHMVDSPDQPFCDGCEESEHHLLPNQVGMQNIVKENQ